jgi:predicted NBD/HSP70 family sugar kinase
MPSRPQLNLTDIQKRIVWRIRQQGPTSRIQLSRDLQLAPAALTRISRELSALQIITDLSVDQTGDRGRPTMPVGLSGHAGYSIGATVHPGWIDLIATDFCGKVIGEERKAFHSAQIDDFLSVLTQWIGSHSALATGFRGRFLGLGIGVPGPNEANAPDQRVVVDWLHGWRGLKIADYCSDHLGLPVWVENDANCAALAELYCGGIHSYGDCVIVLFLGHGVGGGVIANRDLFTGAFGNSGEIGRLYPGRLPRPSGIDLLKRLKAAGADIEDLMTLNQILDSHAVFLEQWCVDAASQLQLAVHSGISWLDPGAVVISGALPSVIIQRVRDLLENGGWIDDNFRLPQPKILASSLGSQSVALGAALLPIHACTVLTGQF